MPIKLRLFTLRDALEKGGIDGGLAFLNAAVPHRYTALYQLRDGTLENIALADKLGEVKPEYLERVPFEVSFCQFVIRDGAFATEDSSLDSRLDGHPYKGVMLAYHGVPVLDDRAELFGTLCHFDVATRDLPDDEFEFLNQAARVVPAYLPRR